MNLEFRDISKEEIEKAFGRMAQKEMSYFHVNIQEFLINYGLVKKVEWVDFWTAWNDCDKTKQEYVSENKERMVYCNNCENNGPHNTRYSMSLFSPDLMRMKWRKV